MDAMIFAPLAYVCFGIGVSAICLARLVALRRKPASRTLRLIEGVPLILLIVSVLVVVTLSITDRNVFHHELPPGSMCVVDGHRMRIDCQGLGNPTLVLDAGLGNDGLVWTGVQPDLARVTRTCSFDRAGYGWSDPTATQRDANDLSVELHKLLAAAGIYGPIILVGHSIAGLYIRAYAAQYPKEVAGLVFVDSSVPPDLQASQAEQESSPSAKKGIGEILFAMKLNRLLGACPGSIPGERLALVAPRLEGICREHLATFQGELSNFGMSASEAAAFQSFQMPILILSRETGDNTWNLRQEELKMLSTNTRRVVVAHSGHYIQIDQPVAFEEQLHSFVQQVRGSLVH